MCNYEEGMVDSIGRSALMFALKHEEFEIAKILVSEAGKVCDNGKTALHYAFELGFKYFNEMKDFY